MIEWLKRILFRKYFVMIERKVDELKQVEAALNEKLKVEKSVYTTIKSFRGLNKEYYAWVCSILSSEEFKFMVFDLRENVIEKRHNLTQEGFTARIDMLETICEYLKIIKAEYEDSIRRRAENTEKQPDATGCERLCA